jgi:hypothetical protein
MGGAHVIKKDETFSEETNNRFNYFVKHFPHEILIDTTGVLNIPLFCT